jgi:hypothetical protein
MFPLGPLELSKLTRGFLAALRVSRFLKRVARTAIRAHLPISVCELGKQEALAAN